ncbi:MAG TPA: D-alanine--D-alanine ligase family protein [Elusimicrobiota bacterium]|nr:D-alanine--D-alanine ligase family protein [Elusimicrobiota bacterium]
MNLLVLCGGRSAEREVSCVSAAAILRNLGPRRKPVLVWIAPDGRWFLQRRPMAFARHASPAKYRFDRTPAALELGPRPALRAGGARIRVDAAFPVLHGPLGEDGTVQGLLELAGVPYVGAGVLGSAVGMDKVVSKRLAEEAGLPVLPYAVLEGRWSLAQARRLRLPVFVKPARLGSSVGVYKVKKAADLAGAVRRAFRFDTTVVVEQGVPAREIECAVLGGPDDARASVVGEIRPNAEFYSYEAKYLDPDGAKLLIPAELPAAQARRVRELSVRAFRALCGYGLARVDFLLDRRTGKLWFNEVNTLPGFTSISMYPKLWERAGVPFPRLVDRLVELAQRRGRARARLRVTRD